MENLLGITDKHELANAEERIGKAGAVKLFDSGALGKIEQNYNGLCQIHKALFGGLYKTAGEKRDVNVCKGNMRFTKVEFLDNGIMFADIMPMGTFDEIMDKFIEFHIVHPFKHGNDRTMRIWLNVILGAKFGKVVDYSAIKKDVFLEAMQECPTDDRKLHTVIRGALTTDLGRDMYLRGIDASFAFEGYTEYSAFKL